MQLLHMVLSSREAMDKNAAQAAQLLLKMDLDGVRAGRWCSNRVHTGPRPSVGAVCALPCAPAVPLNN